MESWGRKCNCNIRTIYIFYIELKRMKKKKLRFFSAHKWRLRASAPMKFVMFLQKRTNFNKQDGRFILYLIRRFWRSGRIWIKSLMWLQTRGIWNYNSHILSGVPRLFFFPSCFPCILFLLSSPLNLSESWHKFAFLSISCAFYIP